MKAPMGWIKNWQSNWRERGMEALVGGAAGLAVIVFYIVARAKIEGAGAGDWLSFAGAIIGVFIAIVGGQAVGWADRFVKRREATADLIKAIDAFAHTARDTIGSVT